MLVCSLNLAYIHTIYIHTFYIVDQYSYAYVAQSYQPLGTGKLGLDLYTRHSSKYIIQGESK